MVIVEMKQRPQIDHHAANIEWKGLMTDRRWKAELYLRGRQIPSDQAGQDKETAIGMCKYCHGLSLVFDFPKLEMLRQIQSPYCCAHNFHIFGNVIA
jgi:hypothetical protein